MFSTFSLVFINKMPYDITCLYEVGIGSHLRLEPCYGSLLIHYWSKIPIMEKWIRIFKSQLNPEKSQEPVPNYTCFMSQKSYIAGH